VKRPSASGPERENFPVIGVVPILWMAAEVTSELGDLGSVPTVWKSSSRLLPLGGWAIGTALFTCAVTVV
jgi:hypothetical protein